MHALFADDVKPFSEITLVSAGTDLQESLSMLESRCSTWQLSVSIETSHVLHIGFNNVSVQYIYKSFSSYSG